MRALKLFFFLISLILPFSGLSACNIAVNDMNFGIYTSNQSAYVDSTAIISISSCLDLGYRIKLSAGSSGNTNNRTLKSGPTSLNYNLYKNPARTTRWGNTNADDVSGLLALCGFSIFPPCQFTIYGRIPGNQNIPAGDYNDTIVVTLEY